jgi:hypothetical protein
MTGRPLSRGGLGLGAGVEGENGTLVEGLGEGFGNGGSVDGAP